MTSAIAVPGSFSQFAFVYGEPSGSAVIRQEPADFQVDEILGFDPTGSGEHLYLKVRKQNLSTPEAAAYLASRLGTRPGELGYSGMKDKRAVTTQWFSVPEKRARELGAGDLGNDRLEVLEVLANDRKLRIGSHRGNRFRLRLRHVSGEFGELDERLRSIQAAGVPNYFGPQRLGRQMSNVLQAQEYLRGFDERKGGRRSSGKKNSILLSAARSFLFNLIVSRRVSDRTWNRLLPGEVLNLNGTARFFKAQAEDAGELERRLLELDVHPTGLLAGRPGKNDRYLATGEVAELEAEVLSGFPEMLEGLARAGVESSRRALRLLPGDLNWEFEAEDSLVLHFSLGAGGYATALLRELVRFE